MEQLYSSAEVFALSTNYDMVLFEAIYFNQCVLTTANGGLNMMIVNGKNRYVFENFNVKEWNANILDILKNNQKRKEIAERAHRTINEEFTWQRLAPKFIIEYERKLIRSR